MFKVRSQLNKNKKQNVEDILQKIQIIIELE